MGCAMERRDGIIAARRERAMAIGASAKSTLLTLTDSAKIFFNNLKILGCSALRDGLARS